MNSHKKGAVFVVSGPSGVGKDTVLKELMPRLGDRAVMSVSNTTRPPRSGEVDGVDYNFIGEDEFRRAIAEGKMLEYTEYCSVLYGTPLDPIKKWVDEGKAVILKIEREGMLNVRKRMPEAVTVFIAPPSEEVLEKRIRGRQSETSAAIEKRLNRARYEMKMSGDYDHRIVNDGLEETVNELEKLILKYIG